MRQQGGRGLSGIRQAGGKVDPFRRMREGNPDLWDRHWHSITANKIPGIRAALCTDCFCAEATRLHNDANVLALGGRVVGAGLAVKIVDTFLHTPFSNEERHINRIRQIEE